MVHQDDAQGRTGRSQAGWSHPHSQCLSPPLSPIGKASLQDQHGEMNFLASVRSYEPFGNWKEEILIALPGKFIYVHNFAEGSSQKKIAG